VEGHRSALARDLPRGLPTADISLGHMKISLTLEHTLHMGRHVRVCASCFCTEACSHWFLVWVVDEDKSVTVFEDEFDDYRELLEQQVKEFSEKAQIPKAMLE